jgi:hypothetical protein
MPSRIVAPLNLTFFGIEILLYSRIELFSNRKPDSNFEIPQAVDFSNTADGFTHEIRKLFRTPDDVQYTYSFVMYNRAR